MSREDEAVRKLLAGLQDVRVGATDGSEFAGTLNLGVVQNVRRKKTLVRYVQDSMQGYDVGWVHQEICDELEKFALACQRKESPRLMLFMPPRHGKSFIVSQRFPSWILGNYPDTEIIAASYSADLSISFADESMKLCSDEYHQGVFPEFKLGDTKKKNEWHTSEGGKYKAAGVDGPISGRGADLFIIDDPIKNWEDAYSKISREKAWNWFTSTAYSRLSPGAGILLIMTRWHEDDLAGRILKADKAHGKWKVIDYPAIAIDSETHRKPGEALHPARYDEARLKDIRETVGNRVWASLYQQKPRIEGGHHIQREHFRLIGKHDLPPNLQWRRFWDLAVKAKQSSDYTASAKCAMDSEGNFYIMNVTRFKRQWAGTKRVIVQTGKVEKIPIGIETVSAFEIAMQEIKVPLRGIAPVRGYQVVKDKLTRAIPWIDLAENGKVFIVEGAWIEDFLEECERFDPIKDAYHDDQVDAVSGAYQMVKRANRKPQLLL